MRLLAAIRARDNVRNFIVAIVCAVCIEAVGANTWTNSFGLNLGNSSKAFAVAVDGSDNIYVTGQGWNTTNAEDFVTIAYTSAGAALWTNLYGGAQHFTDIAVAIAVGGDTNIYVTGESRSLSRDYATVAYNAAGKPLWTNYYDPGLTYDDIPVGIVVNMQGKVFVTGTSVLVGNDFATVAYSADGLGLWTNRYSGNGVFSDDSVCGISCDETNVYVVGRTRTASGDHDFATVAYSELGMALWTNYFNGPQNTNDYPATIACGANGIVFVAGYTGGAGSEDYVTIAYSSGGGALWTNYYNGPANGRDQAAAMCVTPEGNLCVTGVSRRGSSSYGYGTVCYTSAGVPVWTNMYVAPGLPVGLVTLTPKAITVDQDGKTYITGWVIAGSVTRWVTIALSNTGGLLWSHQHPAAASSIAEDIALDSQGNIYVTGATGINCCTVKFSASTTPLEMVTSQSSLGIAEGQFGFDVAGP